METRLVIAYALIALMIASAAYFIWRAWRARRNDPRYGWRRRRR